MKFPYTILASKEIFIQLLPLSSMKNLPKNLTHLYHPLKVHVVEIRGKIPTFPCHIPCNLPDNMSKDIDCHFAHQPESIDGL